ncbi:MAG: helix-turn-helix domain-containing protein [Selenomonadaceae bacterium]|nr:helix-turn-helix domain-containing protein [Selenomonadaceae bacterium]
MEWATSSENQKHAVETGLHKSGEDSPEAKLTNEQILYIRENPDGLNLKQLAEKFGVDQTAISLIQLGKTWKQAGGTIRGKIEPHVTDEMRAQIVARYKAGGITMRELAKQFGFSLKTVWKIIHELD